MAKKRNWFETIWGLVIVIALVLIILGLLIWAIAGIANAGYMLWAIIIMLLLIVGIIAGIIFSEGFRSFMLRLFGRRR